MSRYSVEINGHKAEQRFSTMQKAADTLSISLVTNFVVYVIDEERRGYFKKFKAVPAAIPLLGVELEGVE